MSIVNFNICKTNQKNTFVMDNLVIEGNQQIQDKPDIQAIDVQTVCRACMAQSDELENIFKVFTAEMFYFCTSVKISESDGMPDSLCQKCFWLLNRVYYFKQLVLRSNTVLKQGILVKVLEDIDSLEVGVTTDDLFVDSLEENENEPPAKQTATNDHTYCYVADITAPSGQSNMQNKICLPLQVSKTQPIERRIAFKCPKCGMTTHNYEKLTQHLNMHLNEKLVNFKRPVRVKTPKPLNYTCDLCGVTLKSGFSYKNHLKRHTAIRNILCPVCSKCFALEWDLKNHMKTHTAIHHKCDICDKSFKSKQSMEIHRRTHTGEKPFECEFCQKRYVNKNCLRLHRTIHTGERLHKCEICDRRFTMKCILLRHLQSHAPKAKKPRNCVKYHEMLLSAERPHECEICRRAFKRKCGLARHMKIHNIHHMEQNEEVQENKNIRQESAIDFVLLDEIVPNVEFPINEQLQYAIMKVCSDINKGV